MKRYFFYGAVIVIIGFVVVFFKPWAYLPHPRIVLAAPYRLTDTPTFMIPMGETIYHPKPKVPHGHPGIDFGWEGQGLHDVVASAAGKVTSVTIGKSEPGKYDLEVQSGDYDVRYKEMNSSVVKVGDRIERGQKLGDVGNYCDPQHCWSNLHWELASVSLLRDRFCPVTYLAPDSRTAIENLWATIPSTDKVKSKFPNICDGDYAGKVE